MKFPFNYQVDNNDCGPTCLKMIAEYYGQRYDLELLKKKFRIKKTGVSMLDLHRTAKSLGFLSRGVKIEMEKLSELANEHPVILHCHKNHFSILYQVVRGVYKVADPASGLINYNKSEFLQYWISKRTSPSAIKKGGVGYALLLRPSSITKK